MIIALLTLFSPGFSWAPTAEAAFYKYTDKNGVVHFTDRLESIPSEYRNQIKEYKEIKRPEEPHPTKGRKQGARGCRKDRGLRDAEQKKKEAEAKAAQEKSAQEAKQKGQAENKNKLPHCRHKLSPSKKKPRASGPTGWFTTRSR
jgi:hypothetical protein